MLGMVTCGTGPRVKTGARRTTPYHLDCRERKSNSILRATNTISSAWEAFENILHPKKDGQEQGFMIYVKDWEFLS